MNVTGLTAGFRAALFLDGWDDYSIWGYDFQARALFAALWRNTDDPDDPPTVWISPGSSVWPVVTDTEVLAEYIARITGSEIRGVLEAMADQAPDAVGQELRALAA